MRIIVTTVLVIATASNAFAHGHEVKPLSGGDQWILQTDFSDEFDEPEIDVAKWDVNVSPWGSWTWQSHNVHIELGKLQLVMRYFTHFREGKTFHYTSGILRSRRHIKYGYFEARIKSSRRDSGLSPAFWAYAYEKNMWTEIDFVELTQYAANAQLIDFNTHVFHHPNLPDGQAIRERRTWLAPWHPSDQFHTYGCEWDEREIRWYVDGHLVKTRKNEYWHQPLYVVLSVGLRAPLTTNPSPTGFPATSEVEYVRVWHRK
jgi:beta-glucanase (GH16 family)